MKKVIVTTTINPPTEAIQKFDQMKDWDLIVIGDQKTPAYDLERGLYVSPKMQEASYKQVSDAIGWNCIMRRSIGLLFAKNEFKADIIALVDDDNIPFDHWGQNLLVGTEAEVTEFQTDLPLFDPIGVTNYPHLWHRGYPLQLLQQRYYSHYKPKKVFVDVQADFWNGDPDIDAVCRMVYAPQCSFDSGMFPFTSNQWGPFNSQNTFITRDCLEDYFVMPFIGRMDDIWPSYYLQAKGRRVVWNEASVYQRRNPQDVTKNFKDEMLGYLATLDLIKDLKKDPDAGYMWHLPIEAQNAFAQYKRHFTDRNRG